MVLSWRRRQTWASLARVCHDATEQSSGAVGQVRRLWPRAAAVGLATHMGGHTRASVVQFLPESFDLILIIGFHSVLGLLHLEHFCFDLLHLLDLCIDLIFIVVRVSTLTVELLAQLIEEFVEAIWRNPSMLSAIHDLTGR